MKIKKTYTIYSRAGLWITAILCAVMLALSACSKEVDQPNDPYKDDNPTNQGGGMPDPNSVRLTTYPAESVPEGQLHDKKQMK